MFRLALALGKTIGELETMPIGEWEEWKLFMASEPIGDERMDYRLATLTAIIANTNRGKGQRAYTVEEFTYMPEIRNRAKNVLAEESLEDMARAWGAKI